VLIVGELPRECAVVGRPPDWDEPIR
jgi:hypothetical protein